VAAWLCCKRRLQHQGWHDTVLHQTPGMMRVRHWALEWRTPAPASEMCGWSGTSTSEVMRGIAVLMRRATDSTGRIHLGLQVTRDIIHDRTTWLVDCWHLVASVKAHKRQVRGRAAVRLGDPCPCHVTHVTRRYTLRRHSGSHLRGYARSTQSEALTHTVFRSAESESTVLYPCCTTWSFVFDSPHACCVVCVSRRGL